MTTSRIVVSARASIATGLAPQDGANGRVVEAGDVGALSAAMREMATDEDLRISMGKRSRELIGKNTSETWAAGFAQAAMTRELGW